MVAKEGPVVAREVQWWPGRSSGGQGGASGAQWWPKKTHNFRYFGDFSRILAKRKGF